MHQISNIGRMNGIKCGSEQHVPYFMSRVPTQRVRSNGTGRAVCSVASTSKVAAGKFSNVIDEHLVIGNHGAQSMQLIHISIVNHPRTIAVDSVVSGIFVSTEHQRHTGSKLKLDLVLTENDLGVRERSAEWYIRKRDASKVELDPVAVTLTHSVKSLKGCPVDRPALRQSVGRLKLG